MKSKSRKNWILSYVLVCQIEKYGLKLPFAKSEVKAFSMLSPLVLQKIALPVIDSTVFSQFWDITMLILYTFWANSWPFLNLFSRYFRHVDILDQCWPTLNIFLHQFRKIAISEKNILPVMDSTVFCLNSEMWLCCRKSFSRLVSCANALAATRLMLQCDKSRLTNCGIISKALASTFCRGFRSKWRDRRYGISERRKSFWGHF